MATFATPQNTSTGFSIEAFLEQERGKDLLRFSTAGSVDDGKSTLIGRLLYDTQSVYEDQVRSIEGKGTTAPGQIDFALLTDGLRAEREQGITIDVAYRYFSTSRRKFIIADTPGHEQYTRNMATGASTADAAVVLLDASKGVLVQSRRHAYIASLLRVRHILVAVNKMDLIGYDESRFRAIEADFSRVLDEISADTGNPVERVFVPVSALKGDNIVHRAANGAGPMPWYQGPSLLELLESLPSSIDTRGNAFRFPVQRVIRPDHTFRGFAGQIASGTIRVGDAITVQPSGHSAQVERIVTFDGDLKEAQTPLSVTLVLNREVDISRGDLIVGSEQPATVAKNLQAALVWMNQEPLQLHHRYLLKHTSQTAPAFVEHIAYRTAIETLAHEPASTLEMNGIGVVQIRLLRPIALDSYAENRSTGAFILIDAETNTTVAAGMVTGATAVQKASPGATAIGPVSAQEKATRWGHRGGVLRLSAAEEWIDAVERSLFLSGAAVARIEAADEEITRTPAIEEALIRLQVQQGLLVLVADSSESHAPGATAGNETIALTEGNVNELVQSVRGLLERAGVLIATDRTDWEI